MNTPENDTKRHRGRHQSLRIDDQEKVDLAPVELRRWRAGYRDYLVSKGMRAEAAADMAAKIAYRADLYPTSEAPAFRLEPTLALDARKRATKATPAKAEKPARELPAVIPAKPKTSPTTPREFKLIEAATEIATDRPEGDDLSFMHSIMCQVGLPRSRVVGPEFERRSGTSVLSVEAGKIFDGKNLVLQPVPYGPMPRLMLVWLNTYAVRNRTPEIAIGDSASEFMRMLGIEPGGGKRGSYTTFRKQAQALAACHMTLGYIAPNGQPDTYYGKPIRRFAAWAKTESEHGEQRALWPGVMQFSEDYYATLIKHAVPIDVRALMALKGSALAMDIYVMLADRLHRIHGRGVTLYWANLREQFGQEYRGKDPDKDFKKEFVPALKKVLAVYPQAKVKPVTGGVLLLGSPPPIPYKGQ